MENEKSDRIKEAFSKVLRNRRHVLGISQEELADRACVSIRYISLLETNKRQPTISTLSALCDALQVSLVEYVTEMQSEAAQRAKKEP